MDRREMIQNMVDQIIAGKNTEARDSFDQAIASTVAAAMDAKKIEVARNIYGSDAVDAEIEAANGSEESTEELTSDTEEETEDNEI